jgi:hypothetical protein
MKAADLAKYKSEEEIQREVASWLDVNLPPDWRWFHCPNGGARTKASAGKLKAQGTKRGVADVIIYPPTGSDIWIELKAHGNYLSEEQKAWRDWRQAHGRPFYVARSLGEVITIMRDYLGRAAA